MEEHKPPLSEVIELIKQRRGAHVIKFTHGEEPNSTSINKKPLKMSETKPKIYEECMHYLQEYGNKEQQIKFYVSNQLWEQAIKMLLDHRDQKSPDKYFISDVISYSSTTGHLDDVVSTFIKHDERFEKSAKYFEALYKYYKTNKRYNTLYYVQNELGDHVAAAENQVINFFLRKPTISYKELNQRLTSLTSARDNYQQHLAKFEQSFANSQEIDERLRANQANLFTNLTKDETEARLQLITTQIEITRNFAINEVPGCIHGIEVVVRGDGMNSNGAIGDDEDDDSPVTLFESSERRRTFLAALIMIYYDLNCDSYFSDSGIELANRVIIDSGLDKVQVFKTAMRIILEDESSDLVENANLLLKRLQADYLACTKRTKSKSTPSTPQIVSSESDAVLVRPIETIRDGRNSPRSPTKSTESSSRVTHSKRGAYSFKPKDKNIQPGTTKAARLLCDDVIRDSIRVCREPDYKMELSKLLSAEARIELNIELGKLSIAQRIAFDMNKPEYVVMILKEADRLNQVHVKDVCQHWLAKH